VRPAAISEDDDQWAASIERWRSQSARIAGNAVEIIEVEEAEIGTLLRSERPLWQAIRREGLVIAGRTLSEMAKG
jgi:hypothetical protein